MQKGKLKLKDRIKEIVNHISPQLVGNKTAIGIITLAYTDDDIKVKLDTTVYDNDNLLLILPIHVLNYTDGKYKVLADKGYKIMVIDYWELDTDLEKGLSELYTLGTRYKKDITASIDSLDKTTNKVDGKLIGNCAGYYDICRVKKGLYSTYKDLESVLGISNASQACDTSALVLGRYIIYSDLVPLDVQVKRMTKKDIVYYEVHDKKYNKVGYVTGKSISKVLKALKYDKELDRDTYMSYGRTLQKTGKLETHDNMAIKRVRLTTSDLLSDIATII